VKFPLNLALQVTANTLRLLIAFAMHTPAAG